MIYYIQNAPSLPFSYHGEETYSLLFIFLFDIFILFLSLSLQQINTKDTPKNHIFVSINKADVPEQKDHRPIRKKDFGKSKSFLYSSFYFTIHHSIYNNKTINNKQ
jgi:hypothetical protein